MITLRHASKLNIGISHSVNILKEVKPGDILSALLFYIVVVSIIYKIESTGKSGFSIGGHFLSNLGYADNISDSNQKRQKFINTFAKNAEELCLIIKIRKIKCMATNKDNAPFDNL